MKDQDTHVKTFFDQSVYWQGGLYKAPDNLLAKAVIRRKTYALQMVNELADLKKGSALDVGCGSGVYVTELAKMGFDVHGVDISDVMLESSRKLVEEAGQSSRVFLQRGSVEHLPCENEKFDLVLCIGVLGYLLTDYKAIEELRRVLKPGAHLVVNIENLWNLSDVDFLVRRKLRTLFSKDSNHEMKETQPHTMASEWILKTSPIPYRHKGYNLWEFERLMKAYGFQRVDAMTFFFPMRILRRIKFIPESWLDSLEVFLEKFLRAVRIPYFSYSGTTYTGVFKKLSLTTLLLWFSGLQLDLGDLIDF
jgi:ubiquinone/menaquinone biosynthesis C-methylase UbiE